MSKCIPSTNLKSCEARGPTDTSAPQDKCFGVQCLNIELHYFALKARNICGKYQEYCIKAKNETKCHRPFSHLYHSVEKVEPAPGKQSLRKTLIVHLLSEGSERYLRKPLCLLPWSREDWLCYIALGNFFFLIFWKIFNSGKSTSSKVIHS